MKNTTIALVGSTILLSLTMLPGLGLKIKIIYALAFTFLVGFFSYPFFMEDGI